VTAAERLASLVLRRIAFVLVLAVVVFLLAPVFVTVFLSFSNSDFLRFPPQDYGPRQYEAFVDSAYWTNSLVKSFQLALPTAILATAIGLPAVFAFNRTRVPFRGGLELAALAPFLLPGVAYAIAMYTMYVQLKLIGTDIGLILADTIIALPYVVIIVGAGIKRVSPDLELVAMTLGASRTRATFDITLRLLVPSIAAAFVLAFIAGFDEATFVNFVGGPGLVTLPKAIFDSLRLGVEPLITAIATLLMVVTGTAMAAAVWLRRL
jgi:ABC-type spermidine/putrescine transport system permease subunit II